MDIKKYIYGHCVSPVLVKTFDAYSNSYVMREVPCGKCLHCRNQHVNEWVTRLYSQALYSQYVYFVSLDYAPFDLTSPVARRLAAETAAVYHDITVTHKKAMHPLVLCRNHLQDFFKRFRRNTSKIIQYFACGEYGTHAGGCGFGRPHFHAVIFSNVPLSQEEFVKAWTIHGYTIGRVDYQTLRQDGLFLQQVQPNNGSAKYVFRYVCKYLQKTDFEFEKLATIDYHRTYFRSLKYVFEESPDLFTRTFGENKSLCDYSWYDYCKDYAPFTCCSKRPSIGLGYYNDNAVRFTSGDFRLFGLPKECPCVFPRYFLKKAKESLCPVMALGEKSYAPSSNSRVDYISTVLREIYDSRLDFSKFGDSTAIVWNKGSYLGEPCLYRSAPHDTANFDAYVKYRSLHMYDYSEHILYQFNGYGYTKWRKIRGIGYAKVGYADIIDVLNYLQPYINKLRSLVIEPFHLRRVLQENDLQNTISVLYPEDGMSSSYDKFLDEVRARYVSELSAQYKNKLLSNNSKISF